MNQTRSLFRATVLAAGVGLLAACGGGSDSAAPAATARISGTAAAGAPLIGQVTVKDALGAMRTVDIESDGSYSINVSGMTGPFVFRAMGWVGGREVRLTSAATAADINGTINITPFTDLMIANIAGQLASAYFDAGSFNNLSTEELNAAKTNLTQTLMPILTNLGVDAGFDLLRSAFQANHSGFDAVMDVVRVTMDPNTNTALIQDIINNTSVTDDLANSTDAPLLPVPAIPLAGAVTDLAAIETKMAAFNALFANGLPSASNATLLSIFGDDVTFLESGESRESFLSSLSTDPEVVGSKMLTPTITRYESSTRMWVRATFVEADGWKDSFEMLAVKVGDAWMLAGNQRWIDTEPDPKNVRRLGYADDAVFGSAWQANTSYFRILELYVDYAPADVEYIRITGPGFKASGSTVESILMHRTTSLSGFVVMQNDGLTDGYTSWMYECGDTEGPTDTPCIDWSAVTLASSYTYELLDASKGAIGGKSGFSTTLPWLPVSNVDAEANVGKWFASVTKITPSTPSLVTDGTTVTATLTLPTEAGAGFDGFAYSVNGIWVYTDMLSGTNKVDITWSGSLPEGTPEFFLYSYSTGRTFLTIGQHRAASTP